MLRFTSDEDERLHSSYDLRFDAVQTFVGSYGVKALGRHHDVPHPPNTELGSYVVHSIYEYPLDGIVTEEL